MAKQFPVPEWKVTKALQCRHNEKLFVTYTVVLNGEKASCSNCGSISPTAATKEAARNALMKIEAPPLSGGGYTP